MPLLTLEPRAILIEDSGQRRERRLTVSLDGLDAVAHAAVQIVGFVNEHASDTNGHFPDAAAIDAHLQCDIDAAQTPVGEHGDEDHGLADFDTQLRLVVLAAMGQHEQARTLLAAYAAGRNDDPIDRGGRRFTRQLTPLARRRRRRPTTGGRHPRCTTPAGTDTPAVLVRRAGRIESQEGGTGRGQSEVQG